MCAREVMKTSVGHLDNMQNCAPRLVRPPGFGVRHGQTIMCLTCLLVCHFFKVYMSVTIVAMTDKKSADSGFTVLPWDISQKGIILSSMFWGYLLPQIPAGHLSRILGTKYLLFWAMMLCSIATILGPYTAVNYNWMVFCFNRSLQGLGQGFFYPCVNAHIAKWAPPSERNRILGCVYSGGQLGSTLTLFLAGYLSASPWGWPSVFYVMGSCGLLWSLLWLYLGADDPESHSTISDGERTFLKSTIENCSDQSKKMRTPWSQIMTSAPVLSLLICTFGQLWVYSTMVTMLPLYYRHVLHFDIQKNGLISSLPFLTKTLLVIVFSWIADFLISRGCLSVIACEKMWNTIAFWGAAATLASLSFINNATGAVILLTVTVGLGAGVVPGYFSNHLDLAPNFTGLLFGITNGLGSIGCIMATLFAGFVVTDESNADQWLIVFYVCAALIFFSNLTFLTFGTSEVQPWNDTIESDIKKNLLNQDVEKWGKNSIYKEGK